ncbi:MAG: TetR/AcrR family transcriptional regulator [Dinoroseobacter sp.]|nr:TetR/AcrR family transcriptional regulator [Dinoroseobacter sp.]
MNAMPKKPISFSSDHDGRLGSPMRRRFVEGGARLLQSRGPDALQITRVCTAVGLSRNLFYYYFENKKDFLESIAEYWLQGRKDLHEPAQNVLCSFDDTILDLIANSLAVSPEFIAFDRQFRALGDKISWVKELCDSYDSQIIQSLATRFYAEGYDDLEGKIRAITVLSPPLTKVSYGMLSKQATISSLVESFFHVCTGRQISAEKLEATTAKLRRSATEILLTSDQHSVRY